MRFDDIIADALEAGPLRMEEYQLSGSITEFLQRTDLNGVPIDVVSDVLSYYLANRRDGTDWVVLPVTEKIPTDFQVLSEKGTKKGTKKSTDSITKKEEIECRIIFVYELIKSNPTISQAGIAAALGISIKQVKNATEILKERNIIHHEGPSNGGMWILDKTD